MLRVAGLNFLYSPTPTDVSIRILIEDGDGDGDDELDNTRDGNMLTGDHGPGPGPMHQTVDTLVTISLNH